MPLGEPVCRSLTSPVSLIIILWNCFCFVPYFETALPLSLGYFLPKVRTSRAQGKVENDAIVCAVFYSEHLHTHLLLFSNSRKYNALIL